MTVLLYHPQIAQNAGNIVRTCAATGSSLVMVQPLFSTQDRWLKRAGLGYWEGVDVSIIDELDPYLQNHPHPFYFFSSKASLSYASVHYHPQSLLIFGSESSGLPDIYKTVWPDHFLTLPMREGVRCLNLATTVGIVLYEFWRQQAFRMHS